MNLTLSSYKLQASIPDGNCKFVSQSLQFTVFHCKLHFFFFFATTKTEMLFAQGLYFFVTSPNQLCIICT